jgi:hypothetical protein
MKSVLLGTEIDVKGHPEKQKESIRLRCDSASNVSNSTFDSKKQNLPRDSTERGTQTDLFEECEKAFGPNSFRSQSLSNAIAESPSDEAKQNEAMALTGRGTPAIASEPKYRINFFLKKLIWMLSKTKNDSFPFSTAITVSSDSAELSINATHRGITIDLSAD